jgi:hypothetical protein
VTNLSASKAEGSNLLQHQQHCQAQLLELQRGLAAAQTAASDAAVAAAVARTALEPMDGLRLQLAETQGTVAALQASIAGAWCMQGGWVDQIQCVQVHSLMLEMQTQE